MATVKNNLRANAFPQATNDATQGYSVGSLWFYGTIRFQCTDATASAAVWAVTGGAGLVQIPGMSGTIASAATLDIVLTPYTAFRAFRVMLSNVIPATDSASLWCRTSTDGGATYDAAAASYKYSNSVSYDSSDSAWNGIRSASATQMVIGEALSNNSAGGFNGYVELHDAFNTVAVPRVDWKASVISGGFNHATLVGGGVRNSGQDTTALRFLMSSGNIASGKWALYGYV